MAESPDPTRGPGLTALCIVMMVLSIIAVTIRVWSRLLSKNQRFWWDDWTAIASLPFVLGTLSIILAWVSAGLGRHVSQVSRENLVLGFKYRYTIGYLYHFGITLPKYSAILFYIRVFEWRSSPLFRANTLLVAGLVTAWLLFAVFSTVFQCIPVRKGWLPLTPGHCLNTDHWFLGSTISSVVIDVYIMLLPIPVLWNLHTGRARKMVLTGFFFCAYCVIACSLGRLIAIVEDSQTFAADSTWNTVTYTSWSIAEAAISTVCICLPNMAQLFQRARQHGMEALFTRREYIIGSSGSRSKTGPAASTLLPGSKGQFRRIIGNDGTTWPSAVNDDDQLIYDINGQGRLYSVSASAQRRGSEDRDAIALGQVHMRQDVSVMEDERWESV